MRRIPILFYVAMGILALGLVLLLVNHGEGTTFGMDNDRFARLVELTALFTVLGTLALNFGRFGQIARNAVIWAVIILGLAALYIYRYDLQSFGARLQAGLMPGTVVSRQTPDGSNEIVVQKGLGGQFAAEITINGEPVDVLVDTGASMIALSHADAARLGLSPESLSYTQPVSTANGRAMAALVSLNEVAIGPIVRRDVRALVSEEGALGQSLLGMNFLGDLSSFEMRRDELILRD